MGAVDGLSVALVVVSLFFSSLTTKERIYSGSHFEEKIDLRCRLTEERPFDEDIHVGNLRDLPSESVSS